MDRKLNSSWQHILAAQKTSHILGCIHRNVVRREVILPLYAALTRPRPGVLYPGLVLPEFCDSMISVNVL